MRNTRLLREPFKSLPGYVLPRTLEEAKRYLAGRLETADLLAACEQCAPGQFPAPLSDQESLLSRADTSYSPGEWKCFELIDRHWFPFAIDFLEEQASLGERFPTIPLYSYGIDPWTAGFSELEHGDGWQIIARLNQDVALDAGFAPDVVTILRKTLPFVPATWSWKTLDRVCSLAPPPLSFLPTAIRLLDHATDNLFLDPTDETPLDDAPWTLESMHLLAEHWKAAQLLLEQGHAISAWLMRSREHVRKVVDLWNLALWTMVMEEDAV